MDNEQVSLVLQEQAWARAVAALPNWKGTPEAEQRAFQQGHDIGFSVGYRMGRKVALEQVHIMVGELGES